MRRTILSGLVEMAGMGGADYKEAMEDVEALVMVRMVSGERVEMAVMVDSTYSRCSLHSVLITAYFLSQKLTMKMGNRLFPTMKIIKIHHHNSLVEAIIIECLMTKMRNRLLTTMEMIKIYRHNSSTEATSIKKQLMKSGQSLKYD